MSRHFKVLSTISLVGLIIAGCKKEEKTTESSPGQSSAVATPVQQSNSATSSQDSLFEEQALYSTNYAMLAVPEFAYLGRPIPASFHFPTKLLAKKSLTLSLSIHRPLSIIGNQISWDLPYSSGLGEVRGPMGIFPNSIIEEEGIFLITAILRNNRVVVSKASAQITIVDEGRVVSSERLVESLESKDVAKLETALYGEHEKKRAEHGLKMDEGKTEEEMLAALEKKKQKEASQQEVAKVTLTPEALAEHERISKRAEELLKSSGMSGGNHLEASSHMAAGPNVAQAPALAEARPTVELEVAEGVSCQSQGQGSQILHCAGETRADSAEFANGLGIKVPEDKEFIIAVGSGPSEEVDLGLQNKAREIYKNVFALNTNPVSNGQVVQHKGTTYSTVASLENTNIMKGEENQKMDFDEYNEQLLLESSQEKHAQLEQVISGEVYSASRMPASSSSSSYVLPKFNIQAGTIKIKE